tara:strand:+ start:630 stop:941 length:312 start_codon:yes stop_codon:yes gene_type:complete
MKNILNSHPVAMLKQEISKTNIRGYSRMRKAEVIELMIKNKERFSYIKFNEDKKERDEEKILENKKKNKMKLNFLKALSKEKRNELLEKDSKKKKPEYAGLIK